MTVRIRVLQACTIDDHFLQVGDVVEGMPEEVKPYIDFGYAEEIVEIPEGSGEAAPEEETSRPEKKPKQTAKK